VVAVAVVTVDVVAEAVVDTVETVQVEVETVMAVMVEMDVQVAVEIVMDALVVDVTAVMVGKVAEASLSHKKVPTYVGAYFFIFFKSNALCLFKYSQMPFLVYVDDNAF
jgi:hypothetical protein